MFSIVVNSGRAIFKISLTASAVGGSFLLLHFFIKIIF